MFGGQVIGPSGPFGRVPSAPALRGGSLDLALVPDGALMVQPLAPGTLLKGGRYRLIQRFHALETAERQDGDPPLMIASDTELPNGRVLVQELRLNAARPEDTETARRLVAQRMLTLGRHPGMPKLLDHFSERRRHFLVFELPSGDVLSERLLRTRGPVDEVTAIGYALRILDALAALEQVTPVAVHGNLSPANIVLRPSGQMALVGFSPTLMLHLDGRVEHQSAGGMPGYAAPEQARGQASPRSDLYSLCAVLHHLVTGVAPSPRATALHEPARRLNPRVSLELEDVLSHGLRPASGQRYQSVAELRAALEPLATGQRLTHVPDELRDEQAERDGLALVPVRDARGRLVLPRRRASQEPFYVVAAIFTLLVLVGGGVLFALAPLPGLGFGLGANPKPAPTPNGEAQLFQSQGIALSAGEFVFDSNRPDNALKQQAARSLTAGDLNQAHSLYSQAAQADRADAEAAIYAEDVKILQDKASYVTVVAAVAFGDDAAARAELQGVYLAQRRLNTFDVLPGGVRVRVLILNSGLSADGASTAADLLLTRIQRGNAQHLVGVVGWPESEQTGQALSVLHPSGLALVSPTATADALRGNAANFFAMSLSDSQQAAELADAVPAVFKTRQVLVLSDGESPASAASASAFAAEAKQNRALGLAVRQTEFLSNSGASFAAIAQTALNQGDGVIFLACAEEGCDADSIGLARAVAQVNTFAAAPIRILTTSYASTPALLGLGSDPAAQAAQANAAALDALYVPTLADLGAWAAVGVAPSQQPSLADDYATQLGANAEPSGLPGPDATSILSYDAARLLLTSAAQALQVNNGKITYPDPTVVRTQLLTYGQGHRFLGVGGAIQFSITGSPVGKALVITHLTPATDGVSPPAAGQPAARADVFAVAGGPSAFCGGNDCQPS
jgi:serine/threonine protein kinase